jgi:UDP-N-acetylglucosamine--N-acetylmuramyl-(pentapeptide) pyrophosphoryl-undecaprenol N-acetylglucosamine transferase
MGGRFAVNSMALVAGGTGGHIIPAIAFGDWVRREKPDVGVSYMSGSRKVELEIYRASNIEPFVLDSSGSPLGAPGIVAVRRWAELFSGFLQVNRLFKKLRPDICLLFGGYVSIPALAVGRVRGIRQVLHEQNALAGRATRIAAKLGVPIASGWKECERLKRSAFTCVGVPVRRIRSIAKNEAWHAIGARPGSSGPVVSVATGSLGSENMMEITMGLSKLDRFSSWNFFVVDPRASAPSKLGSNIAALPLMWDISPLYSVSDLLVTRGGASTLSEILAIGKPAVIVPWRGARGDHQMKNAISAAESDKIRIWDEKKDSPADLADKIQNLHANYVGKNGDSANLLYNAGDASETNCRRLWNFVSEYRKGD